MLLNYLYFYKEWSIDEVSTWIESKGFEKEANIFKGIKQPGLSWFLLH
jgi:hypothetical protein